jgi:hypothetical protein
MFGLITKLFSENRKSSPARTAPRRASLQVEDLEGRLVPTTLSLLPTSVSSAALTLSIGNVASGHTIQLESNGKGGLEVFDNGTLLNKNPFNQASINAVDIHVSSNDHVVIDGTAIASTAGTAPGAVHANAITEIEVIVITEPDGTVIVVIVETTIRR